MLLENTLTVDLRESTYTAFDNVSEGYYEYDENWGADVDFIRDAFSERYPRHLSIIDLGCATGWHLISLSFLVKNVSQLLGVDYSDSMMKSASRFVSRNRLKDLIQFKKCDIESVSSALKSQKFDIAICLNNTLGNLIEYNIPREEYRLSILKNIKTILSDKAQFIISVYNIDKFDPNSYSRYLNISQEKSDFNAGDIVIYHTYPDDVNHYCYSHWFSVAEITTLLETAGFVVKDLELRKKRILIRAGVE